MKIINFIVEAIKDHLSDAWIYVVAISIVTITLLLFEFGL
tara:strand:- start:752 stop:871 length:120 start_codon:yes stop_codon:yes gene_type:complete